VKRPLTWLAALFVIVAVLAVAGCGFQPRGATGPLAAGQIPQPLFVTGLDRHAGLRRELLRQLEAAGVAVAPDAATAAATLRLGGQASRSNLLSVDARNKALEFELSESVVIDLVSADGSTLIDAESLAARRIQYRPRDDVLAGTNEADLLRQDMHRDLARRILLRLAAR
jgi:LPS-assembly lipoprotein